MTTDDDDDGFYDDDETEEEAAFRLTLPVIENCDDCGACCATQGSPPGYGAFFNDDPPEERLRSGKYLTGYAWEAIPAHLRDELEAYHRAVDAGEIPSRYEESLPCLWFDEATRKCRNYEWRPRTCKGFPVGGKDCRWFREQEGID
jgi:Fe-S-cluster containining protein